MKTPLFSLIALLGLTAFAPQAEASHRVRYVRYYDHCHRPVYGYVYREDYYRPRVRYYRESYCAPRDYYSRPRFSFRFGF